MNIRTIPLRTGLMLTILLMGAFTVAAVVISEGIYRSHAIENERSALGVLVRLRAGDLLAQLEDHAGRLGLEVQHDPTFRKAFREHDSTALEALLGNRFHQYFVTADVLKLIRLEAWDTGFLPVAVSTNGLEVANADPDCPNPMESAATRSGTARLRPIVHLCTAKDEPYMSVLVPIGLRPEGYVNVVVDPRHDLKRLEEELGMPLRLTQAGGTTSYLSEHWQSEDEDSMSLVVDHTLTTTSGRTILTASLLVDMQAFFANLRNTRNNIMMVVGIATIITVMLAYLLTELIIVQPVQALCARLQHPELYADKPDAFDANLISEFAELKQLYEVLGNLSHTDPLTGLANRSTFENRLKTLIEPGADPQPEHAVCYLDLDRFKTFIDTCGHACGEQLLIQVARLLQDAVRSDDLVARIDGDEFAVLLEACTAEEVHRIVDEINTAIDNFRFTWQDLTFTIGASIGVVRFNRDADIENPLSTAHTACYLATENENNHTYYYRTDDALIRPLGHPATLKT